MNTFDIVIASLLVFGFVKGFLRGFFVEIASLIGLVAGVYGAMHFSFYTGNLLAKYFTWNERTLTIVSFAITFCIIVFAIVLLGKLLTKMADVALLGMFNKIFGGVFGALKIAVIISVVLLILSKLNDSIPFVSEENQESSILYKPIKNLATTLLPNFIEVVDEKAKELKINEE